MRRVSLFIAAFWLFLIAVPQVQAQQFTWDENSLTDLSSMTSLPNSAIRTTRRQYNAASISSPSAATASSRSYAGSPLYETSASRPLSSTMSLTASSAISSAASAIQANMPSTGIATVPVIIKLFDEGEDGPDFPDPQDEENTDNPIGDITDYVPVGDPIIPMLIFVALGFAANIIFKKNGLVKKPL